MDRERIWAVSPSDAGPKWIVQGGTPEHVAKILSERAVSYWCVEDGSMIRLGLKTQPVDGGNLGDTKFTWTYAETVFPLTGEGSGIKSGTVYASVTLNCMRAWTEDEVEDFKAKFKEVEGTKLEWEEVKTPRHRSSEQ